MRRVLKLVESENIDVEGLENKKVIIKQTMKNNEINKQQPNVKQDGNNLSIERKVTINSVEDKGEYFYVGCTPLDEFNSRENGHIYFKLYKNNKPEFATEIIEVL